MYDDGFDDSYGYGYGKKSWGSWGSKKTKGSVSGWEKSHFGGYNRVLSDYPFIKLDFELDIETGKNISQDLGSWKSRTRRKVKARARVKERVKVKVREKARAKVKVKNKVRVRVTVTVKVSQKKVKAMVSQKKGKAIVDLGVVQIVQKGTVRLSNSG